MPNIDVKKNLLDHSEVKVRLLGFYLKRYLPIMSNAGYNERIRIYDLFCGEGVYDNGGEGSPLVILRAIKNLKESGLVKGQLPKFDCQVNDIDPEKIEKVKKEIFDRGLIEVVDFIEFTSKDYQNEIEKLIDVFPKLKNEKAFVFIDPYGYKHIKAGDIKSLLESKKAEVLLFLPTQFMYRFDQNGTPESLKDFIDELVEYKNWKENPNVWEFIEQLKAGFRNYLGNQYFVDTFTIQKEANTVFCLFFFSSHIRGFEKMLEAKWEIDNEEGKGWEYDSSGPSLFFDYRTNPLEDKLKLFLRQPRSNSELYEFTLHCGFLPTHCVEILTSWQNQGLLNVESPDGTKVRKGAFYISYEKYKNEPKKITINLR